MRCLLVLALKLCGLIDFNCILLSRTPQIGNILEGTKVVFRLPNNYSLHICSVTPALIDDTPIALNVTIRGVDDPCRVE
jgi:hypothetical protein